MKTPKLYSYIVTTQAATFDLRDGSQMVTPFDSLTDEIKFQLMVHGLKQKICDAAAIPRNPETGWAATDSEKIGAMREVWQRLLAGEWNAAREGGATGGLLLRALQELYPAKPREELEAYLAKKTDKEKAALRVSPKVAPIIERLKAAAGRASGIDADDLLDELAD